MTVSYSADVAKARFCSLAKLLVRWKGGVYKILWREFILFCSAYIAVSVTYRCFLNPEQRSTFEKVSLYVDTCVNMIPLSFVLGFYVSLVIGRWWGQYEIIPWPDRLAFMIGSYVQGSDERSRMIRRTLGRYVILTSALTFQAVSTSVKRRFPTVQHLVAAGLMTREEQCVYEKISFAYGKWWLPSHWFCALAMRAKKEGRIRDPVLLNGLFQEIFAYRTSCAIMFGYDWISVPLVYTQVVTLATYMYSACLVVGRQFLDPYKGYNNNEIDLYVPIFTLLQFFFYMGWLKVAEQILNPYGEDDDDFELNWCLDRTVNLMYLSVDYLKMKHPRLTKDFFWDELEPVLPQTKHSARLFARPELGSAFYMDVGNTEYLPVDALFEQDDENNIYSGDSVKSEPRPSLLRRILSSGIGQGARHRSTKRRKTTRRTIQGFANPSFDVRVDKNVVYTRSAPSGLEQSQPTLNNLHKSDIERDSLQRLKSHDSSSARTTFNKPASRTVSAPMVSFQNIPGEDCLETDSEDLTMPAIPEESSRQASLASIDAGPFKMARSSLKRLHDVQHLVQEANKVLTELNKSGSVSDDEVHLVVKDDPSCSSSSGSSSDVRSYDLKGIDMDAYRDECLTSGAMDLQDQTENEPSLVSYRKGLNIEQAFISKN